MTDLHPLIEQLNKIGIQPTITIAVDANNLDIAEIKDLHANLKKAGLSAEVHINLSVSPIPGSQPHLPEVQTKTGEAPLALTVKEARLNCFSFRKADKAGKPEMVIVEPRIQLQHGAKFFVSSTHKVSNNDRGNGIVFGTGNLEFYLVVDCPPNPAAVGLYVRKMDVELTAG